MNEAVCHAVLSRSLARSFVRSFVLLPSGHLKQHPDSVPYAKALENRDTLKRYINENHRLQEEIANLQETIRRMDQEKLSLDTELAKTKVRLWHSIV